MGYWLKNNEDYAVEDIGTTQSKWRAMYRDANGDERRIIKTFSFLPFLVGFFVAVFVSLSFDIWQWQWWMGCLSLYAAISLYTEFEK